MSQLERLSNVIVLTRDKFGGRVTVDKRGQPELNYRLHPYDARHVMRGIVEALRVLEAAGAWEIASPHARHMVYYPRGVEHAPYPAQNAYPSFETYLRTVEAQGLRTNSFALFSAHQMASCRIGGDVKRGALDPTGETYEVKNLYVADASALPTASGVNPMVTIMGVAHYIAGQIKQKHL
jgi:choline dehydrogenase-like flavoprotein